MKEELIEIGKQLKELAIKYDEEYIHLCYVDGTIMGNTDVHKEEHINICIFEEEE